MSIYLTFSGYGLAAKLSPLKKFKKTKFLHKKKA